MSLSQWSSNGWLRLHKTSREEIANLFAIVERDVADARAWGSPAMTAISSHDGDEQKTAAIAALPAMTFEGEAAGK